MIQKFTKIIGLVALTSMSTLLDAQMKWSPAGPVYTAGRARNMVVDKNDASGNTLYVGSTTSGVFKSTDGGFNWAPLDDQGAVRNISYMAQGPDGAIYAGTGEGFLRTGQKAKSLPGTGLYKLTNNTLTQLVGAASVGTVINRVAVNPQNASNIALATNLGIMLSNDGGSSFALAPTIPTSSLVGGMDVKFDVAGNLYCSVGSIAGTTVVPGAKVYKSATTAQSAFIDITPTSPVLADQNYGRVELAIAPSNTSIVYASCANKNITGASNTDATLKGLFVSYDAGISWALIVQGSAAIDPLTFIGLIASGDYAHTLRVSATDPHTLLFGGYSMMVWKRNLGAFGDSNTNPIGTWLTLGNSLAKGTPLYLHENIHDIQIIPGTPNNKYFFITDAGIFRSTDIAATTQTLPPSFQPFYKGLVTGQFNSVSIDRFPTGEGIGNTTPGSSVTPYSGFIGGTGGNGITYYSGTYSLVTQESSYNTGDFYNAEYSKILPNAAFATSGNGSLYRSSNMKNSNPILYSLNKYTGAPSKLAPEALTFANQNVTTGTPFKMWEYYGQIPNNPDKIFFYNDSLRGSTAVSTLTDLVSSKIFTVEVNRPFRGSKIDSIVVRTATVALAQVAAPPAFSTSKTQWIKVKTGYTNTGSVTVLTGTNNIVSYIGDVATDQPTITLNNTTLLDEIAIAFPTPPFGDKTVSTTNPAHYRVYATIFYRYNPGDSVSVEDKNISTMPKTYNTTYTAAANWNYGTAPAYSVNVTANAAVSNPTYVLLPGNTAALATAGSTFNSLPVTANVIGVRSVSVTQLGTYTMTAKPVDYTLTVTTNTNVTGPTYTFAILPGTATQTLASTATTSVKFVVTPTATTIYTVTQIGSGTLTSVSNFSVNASSYSINPGNVTQASPIFTVNITSVQTPQSYTLSGMSSDLLIGNNTNTTTPNYPIRTVANVGSGNVPFCSNNQPIKIPLQYSARLAVGVRNAELVGNLDAVAVSKNPLALNDPGNFVRVSQNGCMTDDANGNPTTNTISVVGRATILEWSKAGTELFYATDSNRVYRVSHITDIMDLSQSSNSGKFYTDVFQYNTGTGNVPNDAFLNMNSPYRTTLIGRFDKPITSISVASDDSRLVLTFNNPTQTGTTGIVMHSGTSNIKTNSPISWTKSDNGLTGKISYCSMIEKSDAKKVFVGTDQGLYYSTDITTGTFANVNDNLAAADKIPNVQVFDVKQQVMNPWDCYNSGQIYVATNGRGVWTNTTFLKNYQVGIEDSKFDFSKSESLHIFPNPTTADANISFEGFGAQKVRVTLMDISGRQISANVIELDSDDQIHTVSTSSLSAGIYLISVAGENGTNKTGKLIVTK